MINDVFLVQIAYADEGPQMFLGGMWKGWGEDIRTFVSRSSSNMLARAALIGACLAMTEGFSPSFTTGR